MRERARLIVLDQIRSPRLNPAVLCQRMGVSRSALYRAMQSEGGAARFISRHRLALAHAAISDAANTKYIATIASESGFTDPSAFSRAFRREYGVTPKALRAAAQRKATP